MLQSDFTKAANNTALAFAEQSFARPDYAATAPTAEELGPLSRHAFADPLGRLFPMHSKAAVWHSAVYLFGNDSQPDEMIANRLLKTAAAFEIEEDVQKVKTLFQGQVKSAGELGQEPRYAIELTGENGETVQRIFPINDAYETEKSAAALQEAIRKGKLPYEIYQPAAAEILKAARELGADTRLFPKEVIRLGEERRPDFERALELTDYRCTKLAMVPEAREIYRTLVKEASENIGELDQYIGLYREMDARFGLRYDATTPSPQEVFYSGSTRADFEKLANSAVAVGETLIPIDVFQRLDEKHLRSRFPKEAAETLISLKRASAGDITRQLVTLLPEPADQKTLIRLALLDKAA